MVDIDYYIEQTKNMENTSDGGSPAYHFPDVVLVKYAMNSQYGIVRKGEEEIARVANIKNEQGVRTPKHLAVKRIEDGKDNICYVLQERARGVSYANYASSGVTDIDAHIEKQKELASMPSAHLEKWVTDIMALFNMGLELKVKNFFYDKDPEVGGFTIIDLLESNSEEVNTESLKEVHYLLNLINCAANPTPVTSYNKRATPEQVEASMFLFYKLKYRLWEALKKVVPNFSQHERWLLRTLEPSLVDFFRSQGMEIDDLALTQDEYGEFNVKVNQIVDECLQMVINGQKKYWQITVNELRILGDQNCLLDAWKVHEGNTKVREDYEDDYDYRYAIKDDFEKNLNDLFNQKLDELAKNSDNPNVLQAKQDMDAAIEKRRKNALY